MSTHALTIDRVALRVRLPESQIDRRAMLERVRERVLGEALEAALFAEGMISEELICIRSISIALRLDPREGERAWIDRWIKTLTRELQAVLREADPRRVIRYASPSAALLDMARSVAREDLRRAWAWAQLGLGELTRLERVGSARDELVRALVRRAELIVGVIGRLAEAPAVGGRLVRAISERAWIELAEAALQVHGIAGEGLREAELVLTTPPQIDERPSVAELERSPIAALIQRDLTRERVQVDAGTRARVRALAVLALLDAAPMRARRVLGERGAIERVVVELERGSGTPAPARDEHPAAEPERLEGAQTAADERRSTRRAPTRSEPSASTRANPSAATAEPRPPTRAASVVVEQPERAEREPQRTELDERPRDLVELQPWRDEPLDARARGVSEWAGLLLLIAVLRRADPPAAQSSYAELDAIADALALDFRTVLHSFARTLSPPTIADHDPALLAFAGLPPDADPPARPTDEASARALAEVLVAPRARLIAALEARLPARALAAESAARGREASRGEALLGWLIRRRAELLGERGWIELRFDLRDVDTDIRRAGLDLDPGWVPELGVVVRFAYA